MASALKRKPIAGLPSGVGIGKIFIKNVPYWRVRLGKRFTGGKVQYKHFTDLNAARDWIFGDDPNSKKSPHAFIEFGITKVRKQQGSWPFEFSSKQWAEAYDVFRRLPPGVSLTEVVDVWLKRQTPGGGVKTAQDVTTEFLVSRRTMGVRPRTIVQYESSLRIINEEFGEMPIASIERSEIEDWLSENDWSARTRKNYLVTFTTLFNFALDHDYCPNNPASRIERPILEDRAPGILTVDQAKALLSAALNGVPAKKGVREKFEPRLDMVPGIAIGLFAGLRRSELCQLVWSEIDLKGRHIEIKAFKAKTRQRRLVTITDNLAKWLEPYRKDDGQVTPSKNEDTFGSYLSEIASASGLTEWPHNAMRHSFGSYFYAKSKNENLTATEMGNSPAMIFKHYRALVRNDEAEKYWKIVPLIESK